MAVTQVGYPLSNILVMLAQLVLNSWVEGSSLVAGTTGLSRCSWSEYLSSEMLRTRIFWFLECLHIHSETAWGRDPNLNMKFSYVSYIFHTALKVISYRIFSMPVVWM
jgi:hypothetical protein